MRAVPIQRPRQKGYMTADEHTPSLKIQKTPASSLKTLQSSVSKNASVNSSHGLVTHNHAQNAHKKAEAFKLLDAGLGISDIFEKIFSGPQGVLGPTGPTGPTGITGPTGPTGPTGVDGKVGTQGGTGPTGTEGTHGQSGPVGPTGDKGANGDKGDKGDKGDQGTKGEKGDNGSDGLVGPTGPPGATNPEITPSRRYKTITDDYTCTHDDKFINFVGTTAKTVTMQNLQDDEVGQTFWIANSSSVPLNIGGGLSFSLRNDPLLRVPANCFVQLVYVGDKFILLAH